MPSSAVPAVFASPAFFVPSLVPAGSSQARTHPSLQASLLSLRLRRADFLDDATFALLHRLCASGLVGSLLQGSTTIGWSASFPICCLSIWTSIPLSLPGRVLSDGSFMPGVENSCYSWRPAVVSFVSQVCCAWTRMSLLGVALMLRLQLPWQHVHMEWIWCPRSVVVFLQSTST